MGYRVKINYDDGTDFVVEDVFDSREEAEAEGESWMENWGAGRETLELAGEDYIDADIEDFEVYKE